MTLVARDQPVKRAKQIGAFLIHLLSADKESDHHEPRKIRLAVDMAEQKPDEMGGQMGDLAPQRPMEQEDDACYVALTLDDIDVTATMDRVRSNQAGAIVLFAGGCEQLPSKLYRANA
jgi:hypothetical protein